MQSPFLPRDLKIKALQPKKKKVFSTFVLREFIPFSELIVVHKLGCFLSQGTHAAQCAVNQPTCYSVINMFIIPYTVHEYLFCLKYFTPFLH